VNARQVPFVLVRLSCLPPDIEEDNPKANSLFLDNIEADLQSNVPAVLWEGIPAGEKIKVVIALNADVSKHRIGDAILAEIKFCGHGLVRAITYDQLLDTTLRMLRALDGYVLNHVNTKERLTDSEDKVACEMTAVMTTAENGHLEVSRSARHKSPVSSARSKLEGLADRVAERRSQ
jgi:hypothetical protein